MMMKREITALLVAPYYVDVDIVNCSPSIYEQVLKQDNIDCPLLSRYNMQRLEVLDEVMRTCNVTRDIAKELFIRIIFLGTIMKWKEDHSIVSDPPKWIFDLEKELETNAQQLFKQDYLKPFIVRSSPLASSLAIFLQTKERACLDALRDIVVRNGFKHGALIHDGLHVFKTKDLMQKSDTLLKIWSAHIICVTGFDLKLKIKPFETDLSWLEPNNDLNNDFKTIYNSTNTLPYAETKEMWERRSAKIIDTGEFIVDNSYETKIYSETTLFTSFKHLKYIALTIESSKRNTKIYIMKRHPFINDWVNDEHLKTYERIGIYPPPMIVPGNVYNMWTGFDVSKFDPLAHIPVIHDDEDEEEQDLYDDESFESIIARNTRKDLPKGVAAFICHIAILFHEKQSSIDYVLDWIAQIFQQPSRKTGMALLLKGAEGVGKNRFVDLLKWMIGESMVLETSDPATKLYGRFTDSRRNKFLVVINETNGRDNHPSSEKLKDMITAQSFMAEAKGREPVTINCFDRYIFTTNLNNCIQVTPDSRRFVIFEVSSALKGQDEYFHRLSRYIDDPLSRYQFYEYLMARDISKIKWSTHRPITAFYTQMVEANLPKEYEFLRDVIIMPEYALGPDRKIQLEAATLFLKFVEWTNNTSSSSCYNTNIKKFGTKISSLCGAESCDRMEGCTKDRKAEGILYTFDIDKMFAAMSKRMWFGSDEIPTRGKCFAFQ